MDKNTVPTKTADANLAEIVATLNDRERATLTDQHAHSRDPDYRRPKHRDAVRPLILAGLLGGGMQTRLT